MLLHSKTLKLSAALPLRLDKRATHYAKKTIFTYIHNIHLPSDAFLQLVYQFCVCVSCWNSSPFWRLAAPHADLLASAGLSPVCKLGSSSCIQVGAQVTLYRVIQTGWEALRGRCVYSLVLNVLIRPNWEQINLTLRGHRIPPPKKKKKTWAKKMSEALSLFLKYKAQGKVNVLKLTIFVWHVLCISSLTVEKVK